MNIESTTTIVVYPTQVDYLVVCVFGLRGAVSLISLQWPIVPGTPTVSAVRLASGLLRLVVWMVKWIVISEETFRGLLI